MTRYSEAIGKSSIIIDIANIMTFSTVARISRILLVICPFVWTQDLSAAPPRPGEMAGYSRDGTLARRVAFAKATGNDRVDAGLIARAKVKMQNMVMEAQGIDPATAESISGAPPPAWAGMPTTGTNKVLCLLVEFNDYVHNPANTQVAINNALFGAGDAANAPYESLTNFYKRSSYNKLTLQGNTLGWYKTAYNRSAVAQSTAGRENLIKEVLNYYDAQGHDFSQYDNNGDGKVDLIYVIYAGPDTGWGNFWWAYQTSWQDQLYKKDNKSFGKYVFQFQNYNIANPFTPRVIIHETGHALGIPDFYDYDANVGPDNGLGGLDIMDGNRGDHNCFSKWILGWLTPTVVASGSRNLTLRPTGTTEDCVMIIPGAALSGQYSEFFMVQNRTKFGNDNASDWPGSGMMIWHIDSTLRANNQDYLYDNSYTAHKLLRLMEADGLEQIEANIGGNAGDYYAAGKSFTPSSVPNSNRYNGSNSNVSVSNISPAQQSMSAQFTIIGSGIPPVVAITAPAGGSSSVQGAAINITANATDDGSVASVAFYGDGVLISTDTSAPYAATWNGATVGNHLLTAVATDNIALTTTSAAVAITVTGAGPANDAFAGRFAISGNVATVTGTNVGASAEGSEPTHAGNSPQKSVWWTWTPSVTGTATITTLGSGYDTILAAYTGTTIGGLVAKASNDDAGGGVVTSSIVFAVTAGVPIQLAVDGYSGAAGAITLNVSAVVVTPGNDAFSGAILISNAASPVTVTGTNNGATAEAGEPAHATFGPFGSVWWKWTAPSSGTLEVSTGGSGFDTLLGVYTGATVNALTVRASNDDLSGADRTSYVSLPVVAGTTYYIAVDGYSGASGSINVKASFYHANEPPTITLGSPADGESVGLNTFLHLSAEAYDPEGHVDEVRFYLNGVLVATVPSSPEQISYDADSFITSPGYYTVTATAEDDLGLTSSTTATILVGAITLPQALNNLTLPWVSGGSKSWSGTAAYSHDGSASAVSGVTGNSQQSWFSTDVTGPGNVSCWWSVSSEAGFDFLTFYIDGVAQPGKISGSVPWTQASWSVPAGNHTLKWQYEKDGSDVAGADAAWVDEVIWLTPPSISGLAAVSAPTSVPFSYSLNAVGSVTAYSVQSGTLPPGLTLNPGSGIISGSPTTAGIYTVTLQGSNAAGSGSTAVTFTIFNALPIPVSADTPPLAWTTGGDSVWYGESTVTHDGTDAVQTGDVIDSRSTWSQTSVSGAGTLTFWWKISSEANYDFLRFTIDGVQQATAVAISGTVDWQQVTVAIPAGNHALRWTYSKDSTVSSGLDAAWFDQVVFAPVLPQALDTPAVVWTTSGNAGWAGQILTTHDGVDAAQSGDINDSQQSSTEFPVTGAGSLSFWWKVSSEAGFDYLRFFLDGVEQAGATAVSGEVDWQQKTVLIPAGAHTVRWTYSKDDSASGGADGGWLDQVVYSPFNFSAPGTTAGQALWNRPDAGSPPSILSTRGTAVRYDVMRFTVSATGLYSLKSTGTNPAAWDNFLFLYGSAFNPAAPMANVLQGNDDFPNPGIAGFSATLTAGTTYFLVTSGFNNSDAGTHTLEISGAGTVEVTLEVPGTTVGRPFWNRPDHSGPNPPLVSSAVGTSVRFDALSFTVSATGNYLMKSTGTGAWDDYLLLYANAFSPSGPLANIVIGNDDFPEVGTAGFVVTLTAGTPYVLVTTGWQNSHSGPYLLTITGPGRPLADNSRDNWRLTWFGNKANSGSGADGNDFDNDGFTNLQEYAYGLDPTRGSAGQVPQWLFSGGAYGVTFAAPAWVTGIRYRGQWSSSLETGSWITIPDTGTSPQHTFSMPVGTNAKLFFRLATDAP